MGIKGTQMMTKIHGKSSSASYGQRKLMCMIWNIPTKDDDGNAAGGSIEYITNDEANIIADRVIEVGGNLDKFLELMKVSKLEEMPKSVYPKAIAILDTAAKKKGLKK